MSSELPAEISQYISRALEEDIGSGDVTTDTIVPENTSLHGRIIAKEDGIVAGLEVAKKVLLSLDQRVNFLARVEDGTKVTRGTVLADLDGPARAFARENIEILEFLLRHAHR